MACSCMFMPVYADVGCMYMYVRDMQWVAQPKHLLATRHAVCTDGKADPHSWNVVQHMYYVLCSVSADGAAL